MNNNLKNKIIVTTGVLLIVIGFTLLLSDYVKEKRDLVFSTVNLEILEEFNGESTDNSEEEVADTEEEVEEEETESTNSTYEYYLASLEIPKSNISRGFYDKDSSLNEVNSNIYFLPESDYPDTKNGNVILAAHSGNYSNSYFTNLNKLEEGDKAYIKYKNVTYTYKIVNIYDVEKTGTVSIYRNMNKSTLTLITCNLNDNTKQTIYIAELIGKE
jgi:sortase A